MRQETGGSLQAKVLRAAASSPALEKRLNVLEAVDRLPHLLEPSVGDEERVAALLLGAMTFESLGVRAVPHDLAASRQLDCAREGWGASKFGDAQWAAVAFSRRQRAHKARHTAKQWAQEAWVGVWWQGTHAQSYSSGS